MEMGKKAFDAWQVGEQTGNYDAVKALISNNFTIFSHPLKGKFADEEALTEVYNLISEREKLPNKLTFTNVNIVPTDNGVIAQFNSKGTVQNGKFPYEGFNIIVFYTQEDGITGFQEYFGYIDPTWFKN